MDIKSTIKNFIKTCNDYNIDILEENIENDRAFVIVIYSATVFGFEFYEYNGELYVNGGIDHMIIKGNEYYYDELPLEELEDGPFDLQTIIDFITSSSTKRTLTKIIHGIDELFENVDENNYPFMIRYINKNYTY